MTRQTSPTYWSTAKLKVCKETFLPKCCYQMRVEYITCVIYNTPDNLRIALEDNFDHSIFHCENRCGVCHGDNHKMFHRYSWLRLIYYKKFYFLYSFQMVFIFSTAAKPVPKDKGVAGVLGKYLSIDIWTFLK